MNVLTRLLWSLSASLWLVQCTPPAETADSKTNEASTQVETKESEAPNPNSGKIEIDAEKTAGKSNSNQTNTVLSGVESNVIVTAGSLAIGTDGLSLSERFNLLSGPTAYDGIGTNYSEVVVEGFKIKLGGISFGSGVLGQANSSSQSVFNWNDDPKELEIRDGFNGTIEESAAVKEGTYDWLNVSWSKAYDLKAYAYFDRNYDGTPDWTMYTSAAGIQLASGMLDMSTRNDYDYLHYPAPQNDSMPYNGTLTIPSEPLVVKKDEKLFVNLLIDTFRIVKAWDGRLGNGTGGDPWTLNPPTVKDGSWNVNHAPTMGFPFNSAMVETNADSPGKPYKVGTPSFAITSVPMFATAADSREKIRSEIYLAAWQQNNYTPYNTSNFIVLYNDGEDSSIESDDVPFIGAMNGGDGSEHLHVGSTVRHFTVNVDGTFNFYAGFTTGITKPEWNDGGYYYNRGIEYAGHRGLNFPRLAVDASGSALIGNATRCDDEYNYCVPDNQNVKSATNGATKAIYLKRVR
jgi:hypothetical protein